VREEAAVWTMLFSRMFDRRKKRRMAMEATAAGMEADTVMPANRPRYAFAAARTAARITDSTTALMVISGSVTVAGTTGWSSFIFAPHHSAASEKRKRPPLCSVFCAPPSQVGPHLLRNSRALLYHISCL